MEKDDIIIRKAIVHILDSAVGMPVFSDTLLELGPDLNDFLRSHIAKLAGSDDCKSCQFIQEDSFVFSKLKEFNEENFISISQEICSFLYQIMKENIAIPSGDLFFVTYQTQSRIYLAILKMNYHNTYVHFTGKDESCGNMNDIVKQTATLPSAGSKLSEAVFLDLSDYSIELTERKYEVNGTKMNYFSELFLQCQTALSPKTKFQIVTKTVEQINKKYFEDDLEKQMEAKSIIQNEIAEQGAVNIPVICEKIYGEAPTIQEEFTEKLEKYQIQEEEVKPQSKQTIKKLEKQFLTTDSGIEINIPMEEYKRKRNIEFITNPDGTISVLIKNINHITSK